MALPLKDIRALFPHTQTQIYLNHAAVSPLSTPVKQMLQVYLQDRSTGSIENYPSVVSRMQTLRESLAYFIGTPHPEQIALVQNTSSGINLLAAGLDWQPGQRVLLNAMEFPANVYPFLALKSQGVEVDIVPARDGTIELEDLAAAIRPETRVLSISWVQFLSGQRMDLKALGQLCKQHGVIFCVDGIQALGAAHLNVVDLGIDVFVAGGHKWLMGLQGQGFAYIAPWLLPQLKMSQVGWLSVEDAWELLDYKLVLRPDATRYDLGTPNAIGQAALLAALKVFGRYEQAEITEHVLNLSSFLVEELQRRQLKLLTPMQSDQRLGIVTCEHHKAPEIHQALENKGIKASVREGRYLRFSPHFYNSIFELEQMFPILDSLID